MKRSFIFAFILVHLLFFTAKADVILPSVISDNMVLQQTTSVNIWGKADVGEVVTVIPSWNSKPHTIKADENGKWQVKIKTPKATTNQSLVIKGNNTIEIKNILIGEVWVCSGQSNMDFPISKAHGWRVGVVDEAKEMQDADYPNIRLFHVAQKLSPEQELDDCEGHWEICNVENLKTFSAVAFFFGRDLYKSLNTPIGLIQSTWGGTPAEAWTKMSVMKSDPYYTDLLNKFYEARDNYPADMKVYEDAKKKYEQEKEIAQKNGEEAPQTPKKPQGINHNKALSTLWNAMIHPIANYSIKGVIWYQGETTLGEGPEKYQHVFTNMINSWRTEWNQGDFPFYFVQIAPHYKQRPQIREAQLKTWQSVKNTGMAVITDAGDSTDIHPRRKQVPAMRLAKWALAKTYGINIPFSGPLYKSMKVKDGKVILSFKYTDKGLKTKSGEPLKGFIITGDDKKFYPAMAVINGDKIEVSSAEVKNPVAVRYAWDNFFRVNLYNGADLPASPFRTDNWE